MPKLINLLEQKFSKLTVKKFLYRKPPHTYWLCDCECGQQTVASTNNLRRGRHSSCGCGHGLSGTPEYAAWYNMRLRCGRLNHHPPQKSYANVFISDRYDNFFNFLNDIGPRPSPDHSVDRIDPTKGYVPGNLRWSTLIEQARNKRKHSRIILPDGRQLKTWEYAEEQGTKVHAAWNWASRRGYLIKAADSQESIDEREKSSNP